MPITRSRPVATVVVLIVGYERITILLSIRRFDEYIYAILFVVFLVPHFWIPFVGWGVAHQVAIYKTNWGKFQTTIVIISVGCLLLAVCFLLSLCALLDGFLLWHTTAYFHIITMINMNCALWYINCKGIKIASQGLSECFRRDVTMECSAKLIARYRYLWLNLSELLQSLGNAYARTYSTYCLFMFANITIAVYGALSEIVDHGFGFSFKEMGLFVDAAYCSTLLIYTPASDSCVCLQVDHFIQAIEMNPAVVSLKGYAHVNRELLTSG
ncbi:Gustatory receptor [Operophtera brumata]|uniref:Gustatory receptor n=1 Tax=Operophtera brumata TaxID=104452 RepID=A0A0L7L0J2_OPEBR|nr:Gustatory receptor [Operophtera brumata]